MMTEAIGIARSHLIPQGHHGRGQRLFGLGSILDIDIEIASVRSTFHGIEVNGGGLEGVATGGCYHKGYTMSRALRRNARLGSQLDEGGIIGDDLKACIGITSRHQGGGAEVATECESRSDVLGGSFREGRSGQVVHICQGPYDIYVVSPEREGLSQQSHAQGQEESEGWSLFHRCC